MKLKGLVAAGLASDYWRISMGMGLITIAGKRFALRTFLQEPSSAGFEANEFLRPSGLAQYWRCHGMVSLTLDSIPALAAAGALA